MHPVDLTILFGFLLFLGLAAWHASRHSHSVADFLSANRCAGRYLLATASEMGVWAAISIVAGFEMYFNAGFPGIWWGITSWPVLMIIAVTGWVQYRYRETRCMTMPEFFARRYGRKFRIVSACFAFTAGILNYGIFPGVTARFFIHFCRLPETFPLLGLAIPTFPAVMFVLLTIALLILLAGGQVTVMVTDFFQGQLLNVTFIAIFIFLVARYGFGDLFDALASAPAGESRIDPFDQKAVGDFNMWFFLILTFNRFYGFMAWPSSQGYMSAALTPHEAKMANILKSFIEQVKIVMLLTVPVIVWGLLNSPLAGAETEAIRATVAAIQDPQIQSQMRVPIALSIILPIGLTGLFAATMLGAAVSTDNTFVHSWGGIFIQDILLPITGRRLNQRQHVFLLRCAVVGVAAFAFLYSFFFPIKEHIIMYWQATMALYVPGAGICIIGGLYTRFGNTRGAFAAMFTGAALGVSGMILRLVWERVPALTAIAPTFPLTSIWVLFIATVSAASAYIVVSLLTRREPYNLEQLLRRGPYAVAADQAARGGAPAGPAMPRGWFARLGVDEHFTRGDRFILAFKVTWIMSFFGLFLLGCAVQAFTDIPDSAWVVWWKCFLVLMFAVGAGAAVWFLIGGLIDLRRLYAELAVERPDDSDTGIV